MGGPTIVYSRAAMQALMRDDPAGNHNEWVDEQVCVLLSGKPGLRTTHCSLPPCVAMYKRGTLTQMA